MCTSVLDTGRAVWVWTELSASPTGVISLFLFFFSFPFKAPLLPKLSNGQDRETLWKETQLYFAMGLSSTKENPPHICLNHTEVNELLNKWAACFSLMLITSCAVRLHRFQRLFNSCTELRGCSNGSLKRKHHCWDRHAAWAWLKDLQKWQGTAECMVLAPSSWRN